MLFLIFQIANDLYALDTRNTFSHATSHAAVSKQAVRGRWDIR
jgi:hypothetical protein